MAQLQERGQTDIETKTLAKGKATDSNSTTGGWVTRLGLNRLVAPRTDRPRAGSGTTERPGLLAGAGRMMFGMLVFVIGMQVILYALTFINAKFALHLDQTTVAPKGTVPLLDSMSVFMFLWLVLLVTLYVGLLRFNVIPRNGMGQPRANAANRAAASTTGNHGSRMRASRRQSASSATTTGKDTARAGRSTRGTQTATEEEQGPMASDDVYERVKAAQRARRRRATRR